MFFVHVQQEDETAGPLTAPAPTSWSVLWNLNIPVASSSIQPIAGRLHLSSRWPLNAAGSTPSSPQRHDIKSYRNRCNAMCTLRRLAASSACWTAMADGPQTNVITTTRDPNSKPVCGCTTTSYILLRAAPCHILPYFPVSCLSMCF